MVSGMEYYMIIMNMSKFIIIINKSVSQSSSLTHCFQSQLEIWGFNRVKAISFSPRGPLWIPVPRFYGACHFKHFKHMFCRALPALSKMLPLLWKEVKVLWAYSTHNAPWLQYLIHHQHPVYYQGSRISTLFEPSFSIVQDLTGTYWIPVWSQFITRSKGISFISTTALISN